MQSIRIRLGDAHAEVGLFGGMTHVGFRLGTRRVEPLYRNEWGEQAGDPFMTHLGGDFFCLPFGNPATAELPAGWGGRVAEDAGWVYPHGNAAGGLYRPVWVQDGRALLEMPYPSESPVVGVERRVELEERGVVFTDTVYPRRDFIAPVGIHPIFKLPEEAGQAVLHYPDARAFFTAPLRVDESSRFGQDARLTDPSRVPLLNGETLDATSLPLPGHQEELLLAAGFVQGACALENRAEGYRVTLSWQTQDFPLCLFWFSNRGRTMPPWSGRNLCLGIEPICSAFDLGAGISGAENPLSRAGYATAYAFTGGQPAVFRHRIDVEAL